MTVLQDNMGLDEDDNEKSTRGIAGFDLVGDGNFTIWRVQGKVGGYLKCVRACAASVRSATRC